MITLLRNAHLFSPEDRGIQDLLLVDGRVALIAPRVDEPPAQYGTEIIDVDGAPTIPGLVDCHVHVLGGGGSAGFGSRGPELEVMDLLGCGTTTVIGVLGVDGLGREPVSLLAKIRALTAQGMSAFMLIGAYDVPPPSITGSLKRDIYLIPEVLGIGEIAISDARSSEPTIGELARLAADAATGARLAGKPEVLNVHIGPGQGGLAPLLRLVEGTDVPIGRLLPTHVNRTQGLLEEAVGFVRRGGNVDLTTGIGSPGGVPGAIDVPEGFNWLREQGVGIESMSFSTDGNGVFPQGGRLARWPVSGLITAVRRLVSEFGHRPGDVLPCVTSNPARRYRLFPRKGALQEGSDADAVVLDEKWQVDRVFARGRQLVCGGRPTQPTLFPPLA